MPIYEYRCTSCGHELEKLQKMSDPELTDCPSCSTPNLQKQISAAGFQLKGNGWYATDFKGGAKKTASTITSSETSGGACGAPACATSCAGGGDSIN
jgi:putative FmdB family regulatory protein